MEKNSSFLNNLNTFLEALSSTFRDTNWEKVAETRIQTLQQGLCSVAIYAVDFQQLACDFD